MVNKLLYAMEHADRIFAGFVLSNNWKDLLAGIVVAVVLKVLVWQKQADAKKITERHRVWFSQMGNRRGYQALYVGRSMDEHSIDSNRSTCLLYTSLFRLIFLCFLLY